MKQLTFRPKHLSFSEKMAAIELKLEMIRAARYRCEVCGHEFHSNSEAQLSHIIAKHLNNIQKYGYEAIYHELNMKVTDANCNSKVMINVSKKEYVKAHMLPIYEDLASQGYDVGDATDRLLRNE